MHTMKNKTSLKDILDMEISPKCIINLKMTSYKQWVNTQKNLQKDIHYIVAPLVLKVSFSLCFVLVFFFLSGVGIMEKKRQLLTQHKILYYFTYSTLQNSYMCAYVHT